MSAQCVVPAAAFDGRLFAFRGELAPGQVVPMHTHEHEDEVTIVLAGVLTAEVGDSRTTAEAGSVVLKPRRVAHSMANLSSAPAQVVELHLPGHIEPYYDELGTLFSAAAMPDEARGAAIAALQQRYGITVARSQG
jgi:oxalate decarboxylase/phosphoglucose isomerase-like protein (cupin superfamily)